MQRIEFQSSRDSHRYWGEDIFSSLIALITQFWQLLCPLKKWKMLHKTGLYKVFKEGQWMNTIADFQINNLSFCWINNSLHGRGSKGRWKGEFRHARMCMGREFHSLSCCTAFALSCTRIPPILQTFPMPTTQAN